MNLSDIPYTGNLCIATILKIIADNQHYLVKLTRDKCNPNDSVTSSIKWHVLAAKFSNLPREYQCCFLSSCL